jgi:hypothetical protein
VRDPGTTDTDQVGLRSHPTTTAYLSLVNNKVQRQRERERGKGREREREGKWHGHEKKRKKRVCVEKKGIHRVEERR